ncbi:TPA: ACT domain-containing protein [Candidatus Micrarchaeota archaeon]|nr:ACT domain-containing protein [Candidatus Micrarchaeota archaeon]
MKELHVIAANQPGVLAGISDALYAENVNIESIVAESMGDNGVIRLLTRDAVKARKALEGLGYKVMDSDILVLGLADKPGELARISHLLGENGVNIENVYLLSKEQNTTFLAMRVSDYNRARKLLVREVRD